MAANRSSVTAPNNVAWSARMPKIVRMNLLRRYPIAFTLMALVIVSALAPLPPLVDAVTGAPPYDVDLVRPATYTLLAPLSDVLDARSEEHTSELQSPDHLVCRLLLEKKNQIRPFT